MAQMNQIKTRRLWGVATAALAIVVLIVGILTLRSFTATPAEQQGGPAASADRAQFNQAIQDSRDALDQGEPAKAEALLRRALASFPDDSDGWSLLGESLIAQDNATEALAAYEQAIAVGQDNAELRFAAATFAHRAGQLDIAQEHYMRAQKMAPTNPKHPLYLAQVQRQAGDLPAAKASLLRAATLDPDLALAWASLAAIALDENKTSIAHQHIKRARKLQPANLDWRIIEARAWRRMNQPNKAVRLLIAVDENTRLASLPALEELAMCYGMLAQPEEAANLYARAVASNPDEAPLLHLAAQWHQRAAMNDAAEAYAARAARLGYEPSQHFLALLRDEDENSDQ